MRGPNVDSGRSWPASMLASAAATLSAPDTWILALAAFLLRGGIVVLVLPIVVIPTTSGFADIVAPTLVPFVFGETSPLFVALVVGAGALVVGWYVVAGLVGAWLEIELAGRTDDEDRAPTDVGRASPIAAFAIRFVCQLPLLATLGWGAVRIVETTYQELILPTDLAVPIALRVLRDVPSVGVLVLAGWLAGETVGGIAVRRLADGERHAGRALLGALGQVVRRPFRFLLTLAVGTAVVAVAVVPGVFATAVAWGRVRTALGEGSDVVGMTVAVFLLVGLWALTLVLTAAATAWRAAAWTFETRAAEQAETAVEAAPTSPAGGTIGGPGSGRPGEWPAPEVSGRL